MMRKFTLFCSLALCVVLFGQQKVTAQTMESVGEIKAAEFTALVQDEMHFLELEQKNPIGAVKTEKNDKIRAYYKSAIASWKQGADIKDELSYVNRVVQASAEDSQQAAYDRNDFMGLINAINQLDFSDSSNADVNAIFDFWRTYKNQ